MGVDGRSGPSRGGGRYRKGSLLFPERDFILFFPGSPAKSSPGGKILGGTHVRPRGGGGDITAAQRRRNEGMCAQPRSSHSVPAVGGAGLRAHLWARRGRTGTGPIMSTYNTTRRYQRRTPKKREKEAPSFLSISSSLFPYFDISIYVRVYMHTICIPSDPALLRRAFEKAGKGGGEGRRD